MAIQDFLRPNETVQYESPNRVLYQGEGYDFLVTDARLLLYRRKGLLFKKDMIVAEIKDYVWHVSYKELGAFPKRAVISISTMEGKIMTLGGSRHAMKALYSEMQPYMAIWQPLGERDVFVQ
jgi:hypothetical protein